MENPLPSPAQLVKPMNPSNKKPFMIGGAILIILVGLGFGWFAASKRPAVTSNGGKSAVVTVSNTEAGVSDPASIKDVTTATGDMKAGGIKGEGMFHLDRPGGDSQTVYLTSTTIDIAPFVGKKVQVWGQTLASQNAPWFMDVQKIKVVQ